MQRTSASLIPSISASCFFKRCVACEAVQTVTLPSFTSATAQEGPIDPWVWMAKS
jgi:hypothetical protein